MMGRSSTVMVLLLCFSLCDLSILGLLVTTEARTLPAASSSAIDNGRIFLPPTEDGSKDGSRERKLASRRPPLVPTSPVGGTNKPYIRPKFPPPSPIETTFPPPPPIEI